MGSSLSAEGKPAMRPVRSQYPADVTAANLFELRHYPAQTFDVTLWRRWPGVLLMQVRTVKVKQPTPGRYRFVLVVRWSDRREVMFPDFRASVRGVVRRAQAEAVIEVDQVVFRPNWRSWTPAMAGVGAVAVVLFPLLWWVQGLTFGTIFVGGYGLSILTGAVALWWAYRRGVRQAIRDLLRQAAGEAAPPVTDWHAYLFPNEPRRQYWDDDEAL